MKTAIKAILAVIVSIVLLIFVAIGILIFAINPNDYKKDIESAALQAGYPVQIRGDLSWQFFPNLGIGIGETSVYTDIQQTQSIAAIDNVSTSVAVMPLFSKRVVINEVSIAGLNVQLKVDSQGTGNWEALGSDQPASTNRPENNTTISDNSTDTSTSTPTSGSSTDQPGTTGTPFELNAQSITITDARFAYEDQQAPLKAEVSDLDIVLTDVNLANRPMNADIRWAVSLSEPKLNTTGTLNVAIAVTEALDQAALSDGKLRIDLGNGNISTPIELDFNLAVADLQSDNPQLDSHLNLKPVNARELLKIVSGEALDTADPAALTAFATQTTIRGTPDDIQLSDIVIRLDDTTLKGAVQAKDFNTVALTLAGDNIDVDRYLPPPAEEESEATTTSPSTTPSGEEAPLPLEPLHDYTADLKFTFERIKAAKLVFSDFKLNANNKDGLAQISTLAADFYEGHFDVNGKLDARQTNAKLALNGDGDGIQLKPLLTDLEILSQANNITLEGVAHSQITANSQGQTVGELIEALSATLNADTQSLKLAPFNVEKYACQAAALIQGKPFDAAAFPASTSLQDVKAQIVYANGIADIQTFSAGVEQFKIGAAGKVNVNDQRFDINLPFTVVQAIESDRCEIASKSIIDKVLPLLRCKGDLTNPVDACGLDKKAIRELAKAYVKDKAKGKAKKKLDDKLAKPKEKAKEKLNKLLGEDRVKSLKDLIPR
ncbi:AsmA family protein [Marinibactrum halimedae]|uniref:AsmA domain-containing protein n=1 Tax=Marinibactrum halimedae TaxID=1444977 RepID=A0AA37T9W2_9GAMM|nr:AsmA family protein [Marinibactrum halimedae]MCD9458758.1 AsmA family protein [Marinibactrum halimedae]GLS25317.1 hypothetical protein GCM10007877_10310 [Marinibactrum halimedae]